MKGPGMLDIAGKIVKANALAFRELYYNGLANAVNKWLGSYSGLPTRILVRGQFHDFPFHQSELFKADFNLKRKLIFL
jgi:hypothetical protein